MSEVMVVANRMFLNGNQALVLSAAPGPLRLASKGILALSLLFTMLYWNSAAACTTANWSNSSGAGLTAGDAQVGIRSYAGDCGLRIDASGTETHYLQDDSPAAEKRYIARFYLYIGSYLSATNGDTVDVLIGSSGSDDHFTLSIEKVAGNLILVSSVRTDAGGLASNPPEALLSAGWNEIIMDWTASSASGANNGAFSLTVNGVAQSIPSGVDNDLAQIDWVRIGAPNGSLLSTSGIFVVDAFSSQRSGVLAPLPVPDFDNDGRDDNHDTDDDNDGIVDATEESMGLNPVNPLDALADTDGDGYSNLVELVMNTDPGSAGSVPSDPLRYVDTPYTHPGWAGVELLAQQGFISGCGAGLFCPEQLATRELVAVWFAKALGLTEVGSPGDFYDDVAGSTSNAGWIEALANAEITEGCNASNTLYCPSEAVSRASLAKLLLRVKNGAFYNPPSATGGVYADVSSADFAADSIEQLFDDNLTDGCSLTDYCPGQAVTQADLAMLLARTLSLTP